MTYNTRIYCDAEQAQKWCRENDTPVQVIEKFDGGGFCGFILEFATREHLEAFCRHAAAHSGKWIEYDGGSIEYLP